MDEVLSVSPYFPDTFVRSSPMVARCSEITRLDGSATLDRLAGLACRPEMASAIFAEYIDLQLLRSRIPDTHRAGILIPG